LLVLLLFLARLSDLVVRLVEQEEVARSAAAAEDQQQRQRDEENERLARELLLWRLAFSALGAFRASFALGLFLFAFFAFGLCFSLTLLALLRLLGRLLFLWLFFFLSHRPIPFARRCADER